MSSSVRVRIQSSTTSAQRLRDYQRMRSPLRDSELTPRVLLEGDTQTVLSILGDEVKAV